MSNDAVTATPLTILRASPSLSSGSTAEPISIVNPKDRWRGKLYRPASEAIKNIGRASPPKPGMAVLIPKQLCLEWIDLMALDASLSHVAFRVAAVIAHHLNKHTRKAFLTPEPIDPIRTLNNHLS